MKESGPLGGRAPAAPPGSANGNLLFFKPEKKTHHINFHSSLLLGSQSVRSIGNILQFRASRPRQKPNSLGYRINLQQRPLPQCNTINHNLCLRHKCVSMHLLLGICLLIRRQLSFFFSCSPLVLLLAFRYVLE